MTTELRISVRNTSDTGGTAITPVFTAFHDNSFDIYDLGGTSSAGPIAARELASTNLIVNGASNSHVGLASMLLPSNDAFVGTANAVQLFDAQGDFLGAQTIEFTGASVRDAGTEVNTELDAAFINQTGPNTGETENGVITVHPGFNGSAGNPDGEQIILGGTNAFGELIDPTAADFTLPDAGIATVHINTIATQTGTNGRDFLIGRADDDFIEGGGGIDYINGGSGWDVLSGGDGNDFIRGGAGDDILNGDAGRDFLSGGSGNDDVNGGSGNDFLKGQNGNDNLSGGEGRDFLRGGAGDDVLHGGAGRDILHGGRGDDLIVFNEGDGRDVVRGFDRQGDDRLDLNIDGIESFADALAVSSDQGRDLRFDFGGGDSLTLLGVSASDLTEADFLFG